MLDMTTDLLVKPTPTDTGSDKAYILMGTEGEELASTDALILNSLRFEILKEGVVDHVAQRGQKLFDCHPQYVFPGETIEFVIGVT